MKSRDKISIPEPCHESWREMTPVGQARFCGSCQKNVYDFTTSTDREILEKLNANDNLCGRFRTSQLNRELYVPETRSPLWLAAASGVLGFMVIGGTSAYSQVKQGEVTRTENVAPTIILGKPARPEPIRVTGMVVDKNGPVPGATVSVKGSQVVVSTNIDGNFTIDATALDSLDVSFVGYESRSISVTDLLANKSVLLNEGNITMGVIVSERPNLFRRACFRVRNLFR